jgi:hypothetical protein
MSAGPAALVFVSRKEEPVFAETSNSRQTGDFPGNFINKKFKEQQWLQRGLGNLKSYHAKESTVF